MRVRQAKISDIDSIHTIAKESKSTRLSKGEDFKKYVKGKLSQFTVLTDSEGEVIGFAKTHGSGNSAKIEGLHVKKGDIYQSGDLRVKGLFDSIARRYKNLEYSGKYARRLGFKKGKYSGEASSNASPTANSANFRTNNDALFRTQNGHFDLQNQANCDIVSNEQWVTMPNGSRVLLDDDGNIKGGLGGEHDGESLGEAFGGDSNEDRSVTPDDVAKYSEQLAQLESYPDGTYNLDTMEEITYDSGYQVTFCQIGDNYTDSEMAELITEFRTASGDGFVSAGKFEGAPEVSFNVPDKETALDLGRKYNQISVLEWETFDFISTGGTGRRE